MPSSCTATGSCRCITGIQVVHRLSDASWGFADLQQQAAAGPGKLREDVGAQQGAGRHGAARVGVAVLVVPVEQDLCTHPGGSHCDAGNTMSEHAVCRQPEGLQ